MTVIGRVMNTLLEDNVVPIFKNFFELQHDEDEIISEFRAEAEKACQALELAKAAIARNEAAELAKLQETAATEQRLPPRLSKVEPHGSILVKMHDLQEKLSSLTAAQKQTKARAEAYLAKVAANAAMVEALQSAITKRNDRLYGHSKLAKRSQRFASAHLRAHGAGALH
jgi:hypothetical protein